MTDSVPMNPDEILLDPNNPRLDPKDRGKSQDDLLEIMARRYKIEELGAAIVEVGFLEHDPLIGYRQDGQVYVREGNRRIAALKLLRDPNRAPASKRALWQRLADELDAEKRESFDAVNIQVYNDINSADLDAYVGFRHVSGVLEWPAAEKARYISELIRRHGWSFADIARLLGSTAPHVKRHFVADRLMRQCEEREVEGWDRVLFGNLMRALQASGVTDFLGITFSDVPDDNEQPVPEERIDNLRLFIRAMFGTDQLSPLIKDSRQITQLARVFQSDEAVAYIRTARNPTLERAWIKSGGEQESVVDTLNAVADNLEDIALVIADLRDDEQVLKALDRASRRLSQILRDFPNIKNEYFDD